MNNIYPKFFHHLLIATVILSGLPQNLFVQVYAQRSGQVGSVPVSARANSQTERDNKLLIEKRFKDPPGWRWGKFTNSDNAQIRYGHVDAAKAKGTIVLVTGFTEFAEVYYESITDFVSHGYSVWEMDWRGEGGSDRYLIDRERAYSLGFAQDVGDLDQFVSTIVPRKVKPIILVAHSLGSNIALRYLHDHKHTFDLAILSAPALTVPKQDLLAVRIMSWLQVLIGHGTEYADNQGNWAVTETKVSKMATHSHDPQRVRLEAAWANANPDLRSGGATWKWLQEYANSCQILADVYYLKAIATPILIGLASADVIGDTKQERNASQLLPNARLFIDEGARHELFLESNEYRDPWMKAIYTFIDEQRK